MAIVSAAVLFAPMLLFDLSGYSTRIGAGQMSLLTVSAYLWVPATLVALACTWALARTRYAWLAGAVAMTLALPRFLLYEIGFVLVGLTGSQRRTQTAAVASS
jgi:hypothetical protein